MGGCDEIFQTPYGPFGVAGDGPADGGADLRVGSERSAELDAGLVMADGIGVAGAAFGGAAFVVVDVPRDCCGQGDAGQEYSRQHGF